MSVHEGAQFPLSGAQEGLWFAQRIDPENPAYNTAEYVEIHGALDPELFGSALRQTVGEAQTFAQRFTDTPAGPRVRLDPDAGRPLQTVDVSAAADPHAEVRAWIAADLATAAELDAGPLYTQALFRAAPGRWFWYLRAHHILLDGYSYKLVARRVAEVYTALAAGQPVPPSRFHPVDRLRQEEDDYRRSARHRRDRAYWAGRFADVPEVVGLTAVTGLGEATAPPAPAFRRRTVLLGAAEAERLATAAARLGGTRNELLLAAVATYLHRATGAPDVVLGVPTMSRLGSSALRTPGTTSNVLPLRLALAPETTVGALLAATAAGLRELSRHQQYRVEDLRRELRLLGGDRRLYGPVVNLVPFDFEPVFGGHPSTFHHLTGGAVEDLQINVRPGAGGEGLWLAFDANPALYSEDELAAHQQRLLRLLDQLADAPVELPIGGIPVLLPGEDPHYTGAGPSTTAPDAVLSTRFEARAAQHPEAVAVTHGPGAPAAGELTYGELTYGELTYGELTYGELNARANRLARLLAARGAGPGRLVGLSLPRGAELVVALLAVLKSGAGYVPLDPAYPAERTRLVVRDADPALLVTDAATSALLPPTGTATVVLGTAEVELELAGQAPADLTDADRRAPLTPGDTAYVIHTSGSTGRPKGVVVPHANVVRLFETASAHFDFGADDVWTLFHSYSFDFSVWEIWGALLHGGRLVVVPYATSRSPQEFLELLRREAVTVLNQTPSAFQQLLAAEAAEAVDGTGPVRDLALRYVVLGGEALDPVRLRPWVERHGDRSPALVNMYGITETTVHVTHQLLDRELVEAAGARSPIGAALPDLRVYVLDRARQPVPPGWAGEMYVAGPGLARGYLNDPQLTAERFVGNPFGVPGERMYRTGDLARRTADGALEYLGRADQQLKIRGFRIEPGEVEAALATHPQVARAAVVARRPEGAEEPILVGYAVPHPGELPEPSQLREYLRALLPEQLVPGACVVVDALPLTASGKLDTRALPAPDFAAAAGGRRAATATEARVCALFEELLLLPVGTVGTDAGFFDLGGHSLVATRLLARLRTVTGVAVPMAELFTRPTPGALAQYLDRHLDPSGAAAALPPLAPAARPEPLPLSSAQQSMWFLNRLGGADATYSIPLVVPLPHPVDADALGAALADVVARHESLRTLLPETDGVPRQEITAPDRLPPLLRTVDCPADEVAAQVAAARRQRFDLTRDLPLRAFLFGPDTPARTLVLVLHHSAADGWSLRPLAEDLSAAYAARRAGHAPALPALPVQYADHTLWQRALLAPERLTEGPMGRQLDFWKRALRDLPVESGLPVDRPRPQAPGGQGAHLVLDVGPGLHRALLDLAGQSSASLFMVLHSALAALLTRWGAGTDVAVGTPVAGRTDPAADELIGLLANSLVLRTDTSGDPDFRTLLDRVRAFDLAAYDHQDLPFDRLVEELNPPRTPARHPLFQTMLALQNNSAALLRLGADEVPLRPSATGTAKFDLFLDVTERHRPDGAPDGLSCHVEYSTDLFDRSTVERLAGALHALLVAVAADPEQPLSALPLPPNTRASNAGSPASFDPGPLERELLGRSGIRDVQVLAPTGPDGRPLVLAVPTRANAVEQAARELRRSVADGGPADGGAGPRVVAVTALPRNPDGSPDGVLLAALPRIDAESAEQWQRALAGLPGVRAATVALEETAEPLGRRTLPPPSARRARPVDGAAEADGPAEAAAAADGAAPGNGPAGVPALSVGPPLPEPSVTGWAEALRRAARGGAHAEVVHVRADGSETARSYASLLEEAGHTLGGLRALGLRPGDQVILQCADTEDFLATLWGCLLGGFVAVPLTVPVSYDAPSAPLAKLEGVWQMLDRPWIVTSGPGEPDLRALAARRGWPDLRLTTADALRAGPADDDWHPADPDDTALMLLTSGSTGLPKAVRLSHRNILTRAAATAAVNDLSEHDVSVNWIPLDHVTGVVMFHLRDVYLGCRQVHAPTGWVLEDPLRWLDLADRHRASVTWAPNFAFGLVAEQAQRMPGRSWDLSPVRLVMNAGEVVVAATNRRFLELLRPFGLPQDVIHPGWGMSETSSVVTDTVLAAAEQPGEQHFVSCGLPYPGFAMRIVDDGDQLVAEGAAGRLQVRGTSVTAGYHDNPVANAESFTADGWFETGDLAFLRAGELYITGRAKDVIIVNGVNHYSHEIESCVEELPFVVRSFTAACAVRSDPAAGTDELALFVHLEPGPDPAEALRAIRGKVTREIGVSPSHLLLVDAGTIPKTEIGKIQRTQLRKRFEAGEFDALARASEALLGTAPGVPDWFLRPVWQRAERSHVPAGPGTRALVLAGRDPATADLAEAVARRFRATGGLCTVVTTGGPEFDRQDAARYRLRGLRTEDYTLLLDRLDAEGRSPDTVLMLGALAPAAGEPLGGEPQSVAALLAAQADGAEALLCLGRALAVRPGRPLALRFATAGGCRVLPDDRPDCTHGAAPGLLRSLAEELPWLRAAHLDLPPGTGTEESAALLAAEAAGPVTDPDVAFREGGRWVRQLAPLPDEPPSDTPGSAAPLPSQAEGFLLVTGGISGVAGRLAEHLLDTPGTRLLLVGRTPLPSEDSWAKHIAEGGPLGQRIETYQRLLARGEVRYESVDVTDPERLREAVDRAARGWSAPLTGILHLAGHFEQRAVAELGLEDWRAALAAKLVGGWNLHRLARERSVRTFVSFSSVNGCFGGSMSAAYAAGNSFLDGLAAHQRGSGMDAQALAWSIWEALGTSSGFGLAALAEARGYRVLDPTLGLRSFDLARTVDEPQLLIGVDRTAPWVRSHLPGPAGPVHRLAGQVLLADGADLGALVPAAAERARAVGAGDGWVLRAVGSVDLAAAGVPEVPTGAEDRLRSLERTLSEIWCRVLERDRVGVEENFFDLGGHSLLLVRAQGAVNAELGCELSVVDLFSHPNVRALARHLATVLPDPRPEPDPSRDPDRDPSRDPDPAPTPGGRERARERAERQRAARSSRRPARPTRPTEQEDRRHDG
nr:non-ribosomal peptide synthetase [Streptacidiphilus albus]